MKCAHKWQPKAERLDWCSRCGTLREELREWQEERENHYKYRTCRNVVIIDWEKREKEQKYGVKARRTK